MESLKTENIRMWPGKKMGAICPACKDVCFEYIILRGSEKKGFVDIKCPKCGRER